MTGRKAYVILPRVLKIDTKTQRVKLDHTAPVLYGQDQKNTARAPQQVRNNIAPKTACTTSIIDCFQNSKAKFKNPSEIPGIPNIESVLNPEVWALNFLQ